MMIALGNLVLGHLAAVADIRTNPVARLIDASERLMCAEKRGSALKRDATRIGV
jgi:hypothetical protein